MTVPQDKEEEIEMKVTLTLLFMEFGLVLFGVIISLASDAKIEASGAWLLDQAKGDKVEDVSGNGISGEIRGTTNMFKASSVRHWNLTDKTRLFFSRMTILRRHLSFTVTRMSPWSFG